MTYRFKLIVPLTYKDVELMTILEDGAPELYDKLWEAIEQPLRNTVLEDGRKNGFVDDENDDGGLDLDCVDYLCKIPEFTK